MNIDNKILWAKGNENTIIPTKNTEDMGFDIYANFKQGYILIEPHETKLIPTGLHCAMSDDYGLELGERGSTGSKGIKVGAGKIDSGYRGEIFVALTNTNKLGVVIAKKPFLDTVDSGVFGNAIIYPYEKAICQGIVVEVPKLESQEITLKKLQAIPSIRGEGKLGDSNK